MKPLWKTAPKWANYLARAYDGAWTWFEEEPKYCRDGVWRCDPSSKWKMADEFEDTSEKSLETRPRRKVLQDTSSGYLPENAG